jgi:alpha-tubulin suppressor-like RCC1 family protein
MGDYHACVLDARGRPWCWGYGSAGETGAYSAIVDDPMMIDGIEDAVSIRVGANVSCAIDRSGAAWCWGSLTAPTITETTTRAVLRSDLGTLRDLDFGRYNACAVEQRGDTLCWGLPGSEVGGVSGVVGARVVAVGRYHACAAHDDGRASCFGSNRDGELGRGTRAIEEPPLPVMGLEGVVAIEAGDAVSCALTRDGVVYCWGSSSLGALGSGLPVAFPTPQLVPFSR